MTTKPKHTPGPWHVYAPQKGQDGYPHNLSVGSDTETRSTYVASIPGGVHYDYAQANANLIAAAPDMYEALKGILEVANVRIDDPRIAQFDAARAAIAKAEGETP